MAFAPPPKKQPLPQLGDSPRVGRSSKSLPVLNAPMRGAFKPMPGSGEKPKRALRPRAQLPGQGRSSRVTVLIKQAHQSAPEVQRSAVQELALLGSASNDRRLEILAAQGDKQLVKLVQRCEDTQLLRWSLTVLGSLAVDEWSRMRQAAVLPRLLALLSSDEVVSHEAALLAANLVTSPTLYEALQRVGGLGRLSEAAARHPDEPRFQMLNLASGAALFSPRAPLPPLAKGAAGPASADNADERPAQTPTRGLRELSGMRVEVMSVSLPEVPLAPIPSPAAKLPYNVPSNDAAEEAAEEAEAEEVAAEEVAAEEEAEAPPDPEQIRLHEEFLEEQRTRKAQFEATQKVQAVARGQQSRRKPTAAEAEAEATEEQLALLRNAVEAAEAPGAGGELVNVDDNTWRATVRIEDGEAEDKWIVRLDFPMPVAEAAAAAAAAAQQPEVEAEAEPEAAAKATPEAEVEAAAAAEAVVGEEVAAPVETDAGMEGAATTLQARQRGRVARKRARKGKGAEFIVRIAVDDGGIVSVELLAEKEVEEEADEEEEEEEEAEAPPDPEQVRLHEEFLEEQRTRKAQFEATQKVQAVAKGRAARAEVEAKRAEVAEIAAAGAAPTPEPVAEAATEETPAEPATEEALAEPATEEAPAEPATEEALAEPGTEEAPAEPATEEALAEPAAEEAPAEPSG